MLLWKGATWSRNSGECKSAAWLPRPLTSHGFALCFEKLKTKAHPRTLSSGFLYTDFLYSSIDELTFLDWRWRWRHLRQQRRSASKSVSTISIRLPKISCSCCSFGLHLLSRPRIRFYNLSALPTYGERAGRQRATRSAAPVAAHAFVRPRMRGLSVKNQRFNISSGLFAAVSRWRTCRRDTFMLLAGQDLPYGSARPSRSRTCPVTFTARAITHTIAVCCRCRSAASEDIGRCSSSSPMCWLRWLFRQR